MTFNESLRELCDSVFPKSAQGRLLDLWGGETQRHRDTERSEGVATCRGSHSSPDGGISEHGDFYPDGAGKLG